MEREGYRPEEEMQVAQPAQETEERRPDARPSVADILAKQREFSARRAEVLSRIAENREAEVPREPEANSPEVRIAELQTESRQVFERLRELQAAGVPGRIEKNQRLLEQEAQVQRWIEERTPELNGIRAELSELEESLKNEEKLAPEVEQHVNGLKQRVQDFEETYARVEENLNRIRNELASEDQEIAEYKQLDARREALLEEIYRVRRESR